MKDQITDRDSILDIAKGIGIFCVVMGHTTFGWLPIGLFVYSFHIALFFFISGQMFNPNKYMFKKFLFRKLKTLILPYLIFSFLDYLIFLIVSPQYGKGIEDLFICLIGSRYRFDYTYNGTLWFIIALFSCELIAYFLIKYIHGYKLYLTVLLITTIGFCYNKFVNVALPYNLDISINMIWVYVLGYTIKSKGIYLKWKNKILHPVLHFSLCLALTAITFILAYINLHFGGIDLWAGSYGNYILFILVTLMGIYLIYECAKFCAVIPVFNAISFLGENSIVILAVHQQWVYHPLNSYKILVDGSIVSGLLRASLAFIISLIMIFLFNTKYLSWTIGKTYKGKIIHNQIKADVSENKGQEKSDG